MPWLMAVIVAVGLLVILAGCKPESKPAPAAPPGNPPAGTVTQGEKLEFPGHGKGPVAPGTAVKTREEIQARLKQLESSDPPKDLQQGAMCYKTAGPPATADYVCPKCGEKTEYALNRGEGRGLTSQVAWDLPTCRRLVKELPVAWVELDESQYCRKCSPDVTKPQLVLIVRMPELKEPQKTAGVGPADLQLLKEFLSGSDRHDEGASGESPMKNHLARVEQLLGVKP